MVWSLKNKFLIILKLNFNEGQIYKKISNFDYFKNWNFFQLYKGWNRKGWESALKNWIKLSRKYLGPGWMGGWVEAKAGLRIAYSNQKSVYIKQLRKKVVKLGNGWVGG